MIRYPSRHQRLIGTWKTDVEETRAFWRFPKGARNQTRLFNEVFADKHERLKFTAKNMIWIDEESESRYPYRVLAADQNTVVIIVNDEDGDEHLVQYRFSEDGRSMNVASFLGGNIEFFVRTTT